MTWEGERNSMAEIDREIALFQRADRERIQEERLQGSMGYQEKDHL